VLFVGDARPNEWQYWEAGQIACIVAFRGKPVRNLQGTRHSLHTARTLRIIARDPSMSIDGQILTAFVPVPAEALTQGPTGYRVRVVDYDATTNTLYQDLDLPSGPEYNADPYETAPDEVLLADPRFHAQNAYAIVMRTLARFEFALGRRVPWGCEGHQLHVSPHAFAEPNAFYSREDRGLFFGYFRGANSELVFTSLSHDVVAHETSHAILDGLRRGYFEPSLPDQTAFHEGFADVVALLSIFGLSEVVGTLLSGESHGSLIDESLLTVESLRKSTITGLATQMGSALSGVRGHALRRSVALKPNIDYYSRDPRFREEHARGELIVAAMLNAFLEIWTRRLSRVGTLDGVGKDRSLVVEEGARAANHLLTMAIRAIDYCPPIDLSFHDYLSALLTIDREVVPDDHFGYRSALVGSFNAYGITPSASADTDDGSWLRCDKDFVYSRTHFDSMLRDREEVFRFIWENRDALGIDTNGNVEVQSVRPSMRIAPDGFILRETIVEYVQRLRLTAGELRDDFDVKVPSAIPDWGRLKILGGGVIVFDEYGQVKFNIAHGLLATPGDRARQTARIKHLFETGYYDEQQQPASRFALLHMMRAEHEEGK